jgi:type I restriction enzyme S subunit
MSTNAEWPVVCIKDVCEAVVDCVNKTAPTVDYPTSFKMIRTTNVRDGWIDLDEVRFVEAEVFARWNRRAMPRQGDVILTREAPLGEVGMLRSSDQVFLGQRLVLYRADPLKLDSRFLLYSFRCDYLQGQIKSFGSGATVEHMRVPDAEKLLLRLPPLPVQTRIGDVLSSYDDLIENNARRIKILEETARMIYREWFVNFKFPGRENAEMVESEMGIVPKGWPVQKVTEAIEVDPTTKVRKEGMKPFVSMGSLSHTSMLITGIEQREGNSGSKFRNGDTLFARITPCLENGKTGFVQFLPNSEAVGFGSTEFMVLRSRTVNPEYVYLMARSEEFRDTAIKSMSGATGRQRVQEACLDKFLIAHPPIELLQKFHATATPIFRLVYALSLKNGNLQTTRDLLLPKLISGDLSVKQFEAEAVGQGV